MDSGTYGAPRSGASFDVFEFIGRPQVVVRALCLLFAVVVFGCIASQGWYFNGEREVCVYNNDSNACNFGTGIAVFAFLASVAFLTSEALMQRIQSSRTRKQLTLFDLAFSGFWSFLFFVAFCYLANAWSRASSVPAAAAVSDIQAAIAFSFFSILGWGGAAYLALRRLRAGDGDSFRTGYESDGDISGSPSYPGAMDGRTAQPPNPGGYQDPNTQAKQGFGYQHGGF